MLLDEDAYDAYDVHLSYRNFRIHSDVNRAPKNGSLDTYIMKESHKQRVKLVYKRGVMIDEAFNNDADNWSSLSVM